MSRPAPEGTPARMGQDTESAEGTEEGVTLGYLQGAGTEQPPKSLSICSALEDSKGPYRPCCNPPDHLPGPSAVQMSFPSLFKRIPD